jgi:acetolactate synthase-1/2/3 large subunit
MSKLMNGAEALVRTLLACGVDTCFANPGTSEMHFVAALDQIPGMRCVLDLFEGVATGAADGYARMADKPAAVLLHCGPGLANGLANLHNAHRANTPIVNIVGDQATYHQALDPPLASDTEAWARPVSRWVRTSQSASAVGQDAAVAVQASQASPGGVATLVLPSDVCWNLGGAVAAPLPPPSPPRVDQVALAKAADLLRSGAPSVLFLGGKALRAASLEAASRIAAATGARLFTPSSNARVERGSGRHPVNRLPYPLDQASATLRDVANVILIGAPAPVAFFAYPGKPQRPTAPDAEIHVLARPEHDLLDALCRLADLVGASATAPPPTQREQPAVPSGAVSSASIAEALSALLPEQAIVVDESISTGRLFFSGTERAAPHDWLQLTGGAIGEGIPMATGAAIGAPGRRVVNLQADGSALYTAQGLWTQARERLDVTTVILSNRKYAILLGEFAAVGAQPGQVARDMMSLEDPAIDWVRFGESLGLEAARAETIERFADLLAQSFRRPGPFLIELVIP